MKLTPLFLPLMCCGSPAVEVARLDTHAAAALAEIPNENHLDTVDVGSWNVEWFGSAEHGPGDEALQLANVQRVLGGLALDLVGLVEVVAASQFHELMGALPGYTGVLASEVEHGSDFYAGDEQKPALLVGPGFTIDGAQLVLTELASIFAGRPPLEVALRFEQDGKPRTLVVIVVHLKAKSDAVSYQARVDAAAAIALHLETEHHGRWVAVIGDFNDDLDHSIRYGYPSPFAGLPADLRFATQSLSDADVATTAHFPATIDHHLVTHALADRFVAGSAQVVRADQWIVDYDTTTSDHYPILTRYDLR